MQHPTLLQYLVMSQAVSSMKANASAKAARAESRTQERPAASVVENLFPSAPSRPDHSHTLPVIPNASFSPIESSSYTSHSHTSETPLHSYLEPLPSPRGPQLSQPHGLPQPPPTLLCLPLFVAPQPHLIHSNTINYDYSVQASSLFTQTAEDTPKSELPKVAPSPPRSPVSFQFVSCKSTMEPSPIIVPQILHVPLSPQSPR